MQILEKLKPLALLALRLGIAAVFLSTGYDKLFRSPAKWAVWFPQHGFPFYVAYIVGAVEFFGAILLVLGVLTRVVGLLLTAEMVMTLVKITYPDVRIYDSQTYGFPLILTLSCFTITILGAGLLSIDAASFEREGKQRTKART